jgi:hypothetical protein
MVEAVTIAALPGLALLVGSVTGHYLRPRAGVALGIVTAAAGGLCPPVVALCVICAGVGVAAGSLFANEPSVPQHSLPQPHHVRVVGPENSQLVPGNQLDRTEVASHG